MKYINGRARGEEQEMYWIFDELYLNKGNNVIAKTLNRNMNGNRVTGFLW